MKESTFWKLIAELRWKHTGDDEKIVKPLVKALARLPDDEIADFDRLLTEALYRLDGRAWAMESGAMVGSGDYLSVDQFLYSRCAVVALGRTFFRAVARDPKKMPKDVQLESLLYVANDAYHRKTGRTDVDLPGPATSFETFSNQEGWKAGA